jgi:hypothetical protein
MISRHLSNLTFCRDSHNTPTCARHSVAQLRSATARAYWPSRMPRRAGKCPLLGR